MRRLRRPDQNETIDNAKLRLEDLRAATDDPTMRTAMMDNLFGLDQPMVASFVNSCRFSAVSRVYGRDDYGIFNAQNIDIGRFISL